MKNPYYNTLLLRQQGTCALCPASAHLTPDVNRAGALIGLFCPWCLVVMGYLKGFERGDLERAWALLEAAAPITPRVIEPVRRPSVALRKGRILAAMGRAHRAQPDLSYPDLIALVATEVGVSTTTVRRLVPLSKNRRGYQPK